MTEEYQQGFQNKFAKVYFYCNTGLGLVNNFRNLILVIFAAYFALKIDNYWYLVLMFVVSLPLITLVGWYTVHYMNRVTEWLNIKYGTHYSKRNYAIMEEQIATIKEIRDLLRK